MLPERREPARTALRPLIGKAILARALKHPTLGDQRVADELMAQRAPSQFGRGAGVWIRNGLKTWHEGLLGTRRCP